jgi:hypothetical protein
MLRYDIKTGVKKIKTKTALAITAGVLSFSGLGMAVAVPALSHAAPATHSCTTIQSGNLTDVNNSQISTGTDQYGYNYQAHMFNGISGNDSRPSTLLTAGDHLIMKWSDSWLANVSCDNNSQLDRGLVDGQQTGGISKGWLTNEFVGTNLDGSHYTEFYKIVYVGQNCSGPNCIWGDYQIVQHVYNDSSTGDHGNAFKPVMPGLGLNDHWTVD